MGRPVIKFGSSLISSAKQIVLVCAPPATVSWKCAVISIYRAPFITLTGSGEAGGVFTMSVSEVDVMEFRLSNFHAAHQVLVVPWGDGIRFASEKVMWVFASSAGFYANATMIGVED